jgi:hypothetical protein
VVNRRAGGHKQETGDQEIKRTRGPKQQEDRRQEATRKKQEFRRLGDQEGQKLENERSRPGG